MIIISVGLSALIVSECTEVEDDGYLPPPITAFDRAAPTERAHVALRGVTDLGVTKDQDRREACDVFERGFDHARTVSFTKPSECDNEYEARLWSQTEY